MPEWVRSKWMAGVVAVAVVAALSSWLAIESRDGGSGGATERAGVHDAAGPEGATSATAGGNDTASSGQDHETASSEQDDDSGGSTATDDDGIPAGEFVVRMSRFWHEGATVPAGATFTVYNDTTPPQTFTAVDGSFDSGELRRTESAVLTAPDQPGTYAVISNSGFGSSYGADLVVT